MSIPAAAHYERMLLAEDNFHHNNHGVDGNQRHCTTDMKEGEALLAMQSVEEAQIWLWNR
jgi:hypothetical protein